MVASLLRAKESFIVLLSFDEGFFEQVGIYHELALGDPIERAEDILSLLAKRMARV